MNAASLTISVTCRVIRAYDCGCVVFAVRVGSSNVWQIHRVEG